MSHVASPATLVIVAVAALLAACGLLALQIVLGLAYTDGASLDVQASMIGAMATIAVLPVFCAFAWRHGARLIAASIGVSFLAFLAYSLPATTGRSGEIKEAKASVADDVARWRAEHDQNAKQLRWAVPDRNSECAGAPDPLPPKGWPACRRKTGTVTALLERQAKLEADIKAAGTAGATGDLGSTLWAWALSWMGLTASAIRKGSVLAFAVGLDFAIWSLVALAEFLITTALRVARAAKAAQRSTAAVDTFGQSDFPALVDPAMFAPDRPDTKPDNPGRSGGWKVSDAPKRPKPSAPDGRSIDRKAEVRHYIRGEIADGRSVPSNVVLTGLFGVPRSTVSDWLREWEADGTIPERRTVQGNRAASDGGGGVSCREQLLENI